MKNRTWCSLHLLHTTGISPTHREKGTVYTIPLLAGSAQESGAAGDGQACPQQELLQSFQGGQAWMETTNSSVSRGHSWGQGLYILWCTWMLGRQMAGHMTHFWHEIFHSKAATVKKSRENKFAKMQNWNCQMKKEKNPEPEPTVSLSLSRLLMFPF